MTPRPASAVLAVVAAAVLLLACDTNGRRERSRQARAAREAESAATYQAEVEESLGAAVAILVDTSGSMRDGAPGDSRPKFVVAQEALEAMLDATDAFIARRPDFPIKIGIYSFSSHVRTLRPIEPYNRAAIRASLNALPRPGCGTAIGEALRAARPDVSRRRLPQIRDRGHRQREPGGRTPDEVVREIFEKSEGAVQVYFVAFDTSPEKFSFLKRRATSSAPAPASSCGRHSTVSTRARSSPRRPTRLNGLNGTKGNRSRSKFVGSNV